MIQPMKFAYWGQQWHLLSALWRFIWPWNPTEPAGEHTGRGVAASAVHSETRPLTEGRTGPRGTWCILYKGQEHGTRLLYKIHENISSFKHNLTWKAMESRHPSSSALFLKPLLPTSPLHVCSARVQLLTWGLPQVLEWIPQIA